MRNIMSVDVEDWFHILDLETTPPLEDWARRESHVERNLLSMLDELDDGGATATCFFIGWIAERFPALVRETASRGHEVASHGYSHQLVYSQTREDFRADIRKAKDLLEQALGQPVAGYRAPGFSITVDTDWAFEEIAAAGFSYDSSLFPARRGHGGQAAGRLEPHLIATSSGDLLELPMTVQSLLGRRICFFGGGYLRAFPYWVIRAMTRKVNRGGRPVIYYLHPREVDPDHPRLPMPPVRRFKSYVGLRGTRRKLRALLSEFEITSCRAWIEENRASLGAAP